MTIEFHNPSMFAPDKAGDFPRVVREQLTNREAEYACKVFCKLLASSPKTFASKPTTDMLMGFNKLFDNRMSFGFYGGHAWLNVYNNNEANIDNIAQFYSGELVLVDSSEWLPGNGEVLRMDDPDKKCELAFIEIADLVLKSLFGFDWGIHPCAEGGLPVEWCVGKINAPVRKTAYSPKELSNQLPLNEVWNSKEPIKFSVKCVLGKRMARYVYANLTPMSFDSIADANLRLIKARDSAVKAAARKAAKLGGAGSAM